MKHSTVAVTAVVANMPEPTPVTTCIQSNDRQISGEVGTAAKQTVKSAMESSLTGTCVFDEWDANGSDLTFEHFYDWTTLVWAGVPGVREAHGPLCLQTRISAAPKWFSEGQAWGFVVASFADSPRLPVNNNLATQRPTHERCSIP